MTSNCECSGIKSKVVLIPLQEMLGYTESELEGRTVTDISHEEDRASTEARIADVYAGRRRVYRLEKRYRLGKCRLPTENSEEPPKFGTKIRPNPYSATKTKICQFNKRNH